MPRKGPQIAPTGPQLRLSLQRVLGDGPKYPTNPTNFKLEESLKDGWLAGQREWSNWGLKEGKKTESERKRHKKDVNPQENTIPPSRQGRPQQYAWTEKWVCDHAGSYRDHRKVNVSPSKRRPDRLHKSTKVQCEAFIFFRKRIGQDELDVEYKWIHTGHEPGTVKDMAESRLPHRVRTWVDARVEEGLDWKAIKDLLRIDEEMLDALDQAQDGTRVLESIPEALRVAQKDVYNALRRKLASVAHLHKDGKKSLMLWKEMLEAKGYSVLYQDVSVRMATETSYVFAFVSPWQKKLLGLYNDIACLDSTHNTCFSVAGTEEKAYLYTIVLKNLATGKGCPAAFMITPSEAQYAIIDFLRWLYVKLLFSAKAWMIDCSDTETAAIRVVYGTATTIFECLWHVLKAVNEQSKQKLSVKNPPAGVSKVEANRKLRRDANDDFIRLVYATSAAEFDEIWDETKTRYADYPDWLKYLAGEWLRKKEKWAMCWRKDIPHYRIETNNYVESWHHHLKVFYLGFMRKQRVDVILHILTDKVEPDFRRSEARVTFGFERPRYSKAELDSRKLAQAVNSGDAILMVEYEEEREGETSGLLVRSFLDPDTWYILALKDLVGSVDSDGLAIISCDCPSFVNSQLTCKHMFLASRVSTFPIQRFSTNIPPPSTAARQPVAGVPALLTLQQVTAEKMASITRLEGKLKTINTLASYLKPELTNLISRDALTAIEGLFNRVSNELSAVVSGRPLYAAQNAR